MEPEFPALVQRLRSIEGISPQQWREAKDRKLILENVHKEIAHVYGFEPCHVYFKDLPPRIVVATSKETITLHERLLEELNPKEPMRELARGSRHAYHFHVTRQPTDPSLPEERRRQIENWKQSLTSFNSEEYRNQPVVIDARAFADQIIHELYEKCEDVFSKNNSNFGK